MATLEEQTDRATEGTSRPVGTWEPSCALTLSVVG
jgi:hypothetical protein